MHIRIRAIPTTKESHRSKCKTCDKETIHYRHNIMYRIDELVTKTGLYITWPGLFETRKSARAEIATKYPNNPATQSVIFERE